MKAILLSLTATLCAPVIAAPIYKCVDATGAVTYSQVYCGGPDHTATVVTAKNPPPGGDTPAVMAVEREPEPQVVVAAPSPQQTASLAARERAVAEAESRNEREREALQRQAQASSYYSNPEAGRRRVYVNDHPAYVPPPPPQQAPVQTKTGKGYRLKGQIED